MFAKRKHPGLIACDCNHRTLCTMLAASFIIPSTNTCLEKKGNIIFVLRQIPYCLVTNCYFGDVLEQILCNLFHLKNFLVFVSVLLLPCGQLANLINHVIFKSVLNSSKSCGIEQPCKLNKEGKVIKLAGIS